MTRFNKLTWLMNLGGINPVNAQAVVGVTCPETTGPNTGPMNGDIE